MATPSSRAASVSVQGINPSIDLHTLIACLNQAIPVSSATEYKLHAKPLFECRAEHKALAINLDGVLSRLTTLLRQEGECAALLPAKGQKQGFVRDLQVPKLGQRAWYGGRIVAGSEEALTNAVNRLVNTVDTELAQALGGMNPAELRIDNPAAHLAELAKRLKLTTLATQGLTGQVKLNPVTLTAQPAGQAKRKGRVFTSIETIEGNRRSRLDSLLKALRHELEIEEKPDDEIDFRCEELRRLAEEDPAREEAYTQNPINRFLNFLEDDALARVRLEICFELLGSLSAYLANRRDKGDLPDEYAQVWPLLEYVRRCVLFYRVLTDPATPTLMLDVSAQYPGADCVLNDEAAKAGFYNALPIFPQPDTQIFEQTNPDSVAREIGYRFRINGNNPEAQQSAFVARLERIREILANPTEAPQSAIKSNLLELVLLWAVIPARDESMDDAALQQNLMQRVEHAQKRLKQEGVKGATALLDDLLSRQTVMEQAAYLLVYAMRQQASALGNVRHTFYLNVLHGLINPDGLLSGNNPLSPRAQKDTALDSEKVHFLKHLRVSRDNPRMQGDTILSVKVAVSLGESYLVTEGQPVSLTTERRLPEALVQLVWHPFFEKEDLDLCREFFLPGRIVLRYQNKFLQSDKKDDNAVQLLAAYRTAFGILAYITSMRALQQISKVIESKPHVLVLRLQTDTRGSPQNESAANTVYAASQAFEHVLNRDYPCRLQGLVASQDDLSTPQKRDKFFYRKRNSLYALCAGFPLVVSAHPLQDAKQLPRVGVMTFATRPCDDHPNIDDPARRGFIVVMKTYMLERNEAGYLIRPDSVRVSILEGEDRARQPDIIKEQIRRFQKNGVQHVIYLVHRFGERRRGRSHHRQRVHDDPNFLNSLYEGFDDLVLYPLVRDVFPAVRLSGEDQQGKDGAYEITGVGLQGYRMPEGFEYLRANYTPVYSIGTLRIVGKEGDNKPQSGICTYFLLNDVRPKDDRRMQQVRSHLLLPEFGGRADLLMALRGIHLLESEEAPLKNGLVRPVLDPYRFISPDTLEGAGDIPIYEKTRRSPMEKPVVLSLQAVLARISDILHQANPV